MKLSLEHVIDFAGQTPLFEFAEERLGFFLGGFTAGGVFNFRELASLGDGLTVVRFVPLTEWGGVDLNDGALDESVGPDEFVVGRVVDDPDDTSLAGDSFGTP